MQMRILEGMSVLQYYGMNNWTFENHYIARCGAWMNRKEFGKYTLTHDGGDMNEYLIKMYIGMRRYILKEPDENLPKARRFMRM